MVSEGGATTGLPRARRRQGGETSAHRKAEHESAVVALVHTQLVPQELLDAPRAKVKQVLAVLLLLGLGQLVLGLGHVELARPAQGDVADAEVGPSEVDGDERARLVARGVLRVGGGRGGGGSAQAGRDGMAGRAGRRTPKT